MAIQNWMLADDSSIRGAMLTRGYWWLGSPVIQNYWPAAWVLGWCVVQPTSNYWAIVCNGSFLVWSLHATIVTLHAVLRGWNKLRTTMNVLGCFGRDSAPGGLALQIAVQSLGSPETIGYFWNHDTELQSGCLRKHVSLGHEIRDSYKCSSEENQRPLGDSASMIPPCNPVPFMHALRRNHRAVE